MAALVKAGGKCLGMCTKDACEATSAGSSFHLTEVPIFNNDGREEARCVSSETEEIHIEAMGTVKYHKAAGASAEQSFDGVSSVSSSKAGDKAATPSSENHVSDIAAFSLVPDDDVFSADKDMDTRFFLTTDKKDTPTAKSLHATSPIHRRSGPLEGEHLFSDVHSHLRR